MSEHRILVKPPGVPMTVRAFCEWLFDCQPLVFSLCVDGYWYTDLDFRNAYGPDGWPEEDKMIPYVKEVTGC